MRLSYDAHLMGDTEWKYEREPDDWRPEDEPRRDDEMDMWLGRDIVGFFACFSAEKPVIYTGVASAENGDITRLPDDFSAPYLDRGTVIRVPLRWLFSVAYGAAHGGDCDLAAMGEEI